MREKKLKEIHNFGKIGYIITTIAMILVIVSLVIMTVLLGVSHKVYREIPIERLDVKSGINAEAVISKELTKEQIEDLPLNVIFDEMEVKFEDLDVNNTDGKTIVSYQGDRTKTLEIPSLVKYMAFPLVALLIVIINIYLFRNIFKRLRDDRTPFTHEMVNTLKVYAVSLAPWMFTEGVYEVFKNTMLLKNSDYYSFTINFTPIFYLCLVLVLSKIFEYGVDLQVENDDTV